MSPFRRRTNGLRRERMEASLRFSDGTFRNTSGVGPSLKKGSTVPVMREFLLGGRRRVPIAPLPSVSPLDVWAKPAETGLRATWLGHSTLLLEIDGVRVLTDPVWSRRVSPSSLFGPKRFQPVPVPISNLPPLDAVIISHDHYDHLDYPSIVELIRYDVPFYTSLGVGAHLEAWGVPPERIIELDWWESADLPNADLRITSAPSQHFSGRAAADRNRTLWWSLRPRHARSRRLPSRLGAYSPRPRQCSRSVEASWRRELPTGALGNLRSCSPRVGRARRTSHRACAKPRHALADADVGRTNRAIARGRRRNVVACNLYARATSDRDGRHHRTSHSDRGSHRLRYWDKRERWAYKSDRH